MATAHVAEPWLGAEDWKGPPPVQPPFESDHRPRVERLQVEGVEVELLLCCWVASQEYLEASIELEAIHDVCPNSTSDVVAGLQYAHR